MEGGSQVKRQKRRARVSVWWSKERYTHQSWAAVWVCAFLTDSGASLFSVPGVFWVIVARRRWKYTTSVIGRWLFCCLSCKLLFSSCAECSMPTLEGGNSFRVRLINWRSAWNLLASGIHPLYNKPAYAAVISVAMPPEFRWVVVLMAYTRNAKWKERWRKIMIVGRRGQ